MGAILMNLTTATQEFFFFFKNDTLFLKICKHYNLDVQLKFRNLNSLNTVTQVQKHKRKLFPSKMDHIILKVVIEVMTKEECWEPRVKATMPAKGKHVLRLQATSSESSGGEIQTMTATNENKRRAPLKSVGLTNPSDWPLAGTYHSSNSTQKIAGISHIQPCTKSLIDSVLWICR